MIAPARMAAFEILTAVSAGRADLSSAIARTRRTLGDDRDQALASEIATGVQRMRSAIDHVIGQFSRRSIDRLDPEILEILRLSIYQLLHLSRVPAAAVVNDGVSLAGRAGKRSAAGLVNAVLRAVSRRRHVLLLPRRPADPTDRARAIDYLSIALSHPRWLAERWYARLGFDAAERWMQFNNRPAPLTLRANRLRCTADELRARLASAGVTVKAGRYAADALIVESGHPLGGSSSDEGWFVVQDEASQLVALLAGAHPGRRVLDTCASPGGKTTAISAALDEGGLVVACDIRERRIGLLERAVKISGARNVRIVRADLLAALPFGTEFDTVLVDVPCSGLGTLRRDPDIRWRRHEGELSALARAELRMLRRAAEAVRPGGRLVYATCSSEPEENEHVVDAFSSETRLFAALDARRAHAGLPDSVVDDRGHLRTSPDRHGLEAFFGAVFEKATA